MSPQEPVFPAPSRRGFLKLLGAGGVGAVLAPLAPRAALGQAKAAAPSPGASPGEMFQAPEKIPLTLVTDRPLQLETPMRMFTSDITPNDTFYVRTHLASFPTRIDTAAYKLNIGGNVDHPFSLTLDELRKLPATELVAVNQCSGNSRSFFKPRVPGVQWGNGAMGCAKWKGVRLKDILEKAGVKAGSVEVQFDGLDSGVLKETPDYLKAIPLERAMSADTLVAYEMNGAPLPMLNGFPIRLIVPGWFATYWMKWLTEIKVNDAANVLANFWMKTAYRIPATPDANEDPASLAKETVPINKMVVRSFLTRPEQSDDLKAGKPVEMIGVAFDGGSGIKSVEISADGGATWSPATLGADRGKYAFRKFTYAWTPAKPGAYKLLSRATANDGAQQGSTPIWNRSGYMRNVIESVFVYAS